MNSTTISMLLTKNISKSSSMLRWLGIFAVLFFCYFGYISWRELQNLPESPQHTTLAEASTLASQQRAWVIIDDIKWDCNHIYHYTVDRSVNTNIVFTNESQDIWGYAFFSSEMTCDEVMQKEPIGIIDYASEKVRVSLANNGFDVSKYEKNSKFLSLCTYCGRNNSQTGVVLSSIMVILGIVLIAVANNIEKKNRLTSSKIYVSRRNRA